MIRPRPNEKKSEKYGNKGIMLLILCSCDFESSNEVPVTSIINCLDWF